jgi:hypothetical protein
MDPAPGFEPLPLPPALPGGRCTGLLPPPPPPLPGGKCTGLPSRKTKRKWSPVTGEDVPAYVVTKTSTVPWPSAGDTATMVLSEYCTKLAAATVPKVTAVVPEKLLPVSVTTVPPVVSPEFGVTAVTLASAALL